MTIAAAICYALALVAELWGIGLVVREGSRVGGILRRWQGANTGGNEKGSLQQILELNEILTDLLTQQADRKRAVQLLIIGVVVGAAGNYLSLSW